MRARALAAACRCRSRAEAESRTAESTGGPLTSSRAQGTPGTATVFLMTCFYSRMCDLLPQQRERMQALGIVRRSEISARVRREGGHDVHTRMPYAANASLGAQALFSPAANADTRVGEYSRPPSRCAGRMLAALLAFIVTEVCGEDSSDRLRGALVSGLPARAAAAASGTCGSFPARPLFRLGSAVATLATASPLGARAGKRGAHAARQRTASVNAPLSLRRHARPPIPSKLTRPRVCPRPVWLRSIGGWGSTRWSSPWLASRCSTRCVPPASADAPSARDGTDAHVSCLSCWAMSSRRWSRPRGRRPTLFS
jgi:hypothetical protein